MKKKNALLWLALILFLMFAIYIDLQIDNRINYYRISQAEARLEELRDFRRKLLLEYKVLYDYGYVERAAIEKLGFFYSNDETDLRMIIEQD